MEARRPVFTIFPESFKPVEWGKHINKPVILLPCYSVEMMLTAFFFFNVIATHFSHRKTSWGVFVVWTHTTYLNELLAD